MSWRKEIKIMAKTKQVVSGQELDFFARQLLAEKNLQNVDPEVMEQLVTDLSSRVEDHINAALLNAMEPNDVAAFGELLEKDDGQAIEHFLETKIPNLQDVVTGTLQQFRSTYLGL